MLTLSSSRHHICNVKKLATKVLFEIFSVKGDHEEARKRRALFRKPRVVK